MASGKSLEDSVKDGLITAAGTAATNYIKAEYFGGTPATSGGTTIEGGGGENIVGGQGVDSGVDTGGLGVDTAPAPSSGPITTSPLDPASLDPTQAQNPLSGAPKLQPQLPSELNLDMGPPAPPEVNIRNLPGNPTPNVAGSNMYPDAAPSNGGIYRSSVPDLTGEPPYVPGSGNQPATGTPDKWEPDPDYPKNPKMQVKTESGQPGLPEVVDYSKAAGPMEAGTPTAGQAWDYTKALGNAAVDFTIDHPYYTMGGLYLASQAFGDKDKPKDNGGGDPNKQIGDPRFYQPLEQLQMIQNYDPYKDDIYTYGQAGGEHQFLTSPVYVPVQYADGGPVKMGFGGYTGADFDEANGILDIVRRVDKYYPEESGPVSKLVPKPAPAEVPAGYKYYPQYTAQKSASYDFDPYTYGQSSGESMFFADGGQVGMPPVDPMQQQYASPAVGPMMAPQQMPPQQPMGALSQPNVMGYKPSPLTPRTGRPPVPQQMQGRGAPQQVPPQQQNPDYRYFSYGQIPASVSMPMQQPQGRATGGLAMAHGGNVPDGRTDNIPALLSPGEYVMDAETVALLGNGNNDAGAKRLDYMREAVRKQKGGALAKGKISPDAQSPLAYLSRRMA